MDGSGALIEYLGVDVAKETLGMFVYPSGVANKQLEVVKSKAHEWTSRVEDSKLRRRDVWFLVDHQLWPRLSYGLCSVEAPWKTLEDALTKNGIRYCPWEVSGARRQGN